MAKINHKWKEIDSSSRKDNGVKKSFWHTYQDKVVEKLLIIEKL